MTDPRHPSLPPPESMQLTHFAVIYFAGDFAGDHPDDDLRGQGPHLALIGCGPEDFCWDALAAYTIARPLRRDESAEVLTRHPTAVPTT